MSRKNRRSRRVKAEMNVVPYIDVMLVLLVIFMIATPLIQRSVEVNLPTVSEENSSSETDNDPNDLTLPLILTIDENSTFYLNISATPENPLSEGQIVAQANEYLKAHPQIDVYVSGDAKVNYAAVVRGIDYLRAAGARQVNLSSQLPEEDSQ
ncbi:ExbD/TolR family protein [Suttonella ornithocola]|uniref:Biopolymer transport protein exbD n=1 Tax=Suttonella ornithocola TaxID=279832 RepID=A0A380MMX4_9GAMM|nr:biopolymer transporter ExbD [Suttonella ornithocola]SUO93253.1 Biopolymer transport protein exbD [Suttonella ornithocola]